MKKLEAITYLERPVAAWIELLQDSDPLLRRMAAHALGMLGPDAREATAALTKALEDEQGFVRVWAAAALARVERRKTRLAVSTLLAALKNPQHFVRSLAAWHLGRLGPALPESKVVVADMEGLLHDPDQSVRREAAEALKRLQSRRPSDV